MVKTTRSSAVVSCGLTVFSLFAAAAAEVSLPRQAEASSLRQTPIVRAANEAKPSVVSIHGRKTVSGEYAASGDSFRQVNGMGTGVVIDPRGYILTNYHVIENVRRIEVTLSTEQTLVARLIANDPRTDLAIIKINPPEPLPVIKIGSSHDLMEGETVVAVGNAYGYQHTVTQGIISALHRSVQVSDEQSYDDLIQTDASINPGNSGGPLLNIDGEMIGINVAVRVGAQGIGFAIPVNEALEVAAQLFNVERVEQLTDGLDGAMEIIDERPTYVVQSVESEGPAAAAGLQPGDIVEEVAGSRVHNALEFERALIGLKAGESVSLSVKRSNQTLAMDLQLSDVSNRPSSVAERAWEVLGLRFAQMPVDTLRRLNTRYSGGLKITSVRSDSPAYQQGIRRGDVLVGMHKWATVSLDNIDYVLTHADFNGAEPVKFYIVRGNDTLYGHMRVSATTR